MVRRLGYALGAEVTGLDLTECLDDAIVATIRKIWLDNLVLCIRGQQLSPTQMMAFCGRFGELHQHVNPTEHHPDHPPITMIVNKPITINGKAYPGGISDEWHADQVFTVRPPTLGFLNAQELPAVGGDTLFANMYLAYETLSPALQRMIDPLEAVFDMTIAGAFRRSTPEKQAELRARNPPVVHSLVRVHPETGRKALYVSHRLRNFIGMTEEETKPIFDYLTEHATRYELSYRHCWVAHDLVMWDNRCTLHRAVGDYDPGQLRRMQRCELVAPKTGRLYSDGNLDPPALASHGAT
jgi:taurine dioxygenase